MKIIIAASIVALAIWFSMPRYQIQDIGDDQDNDSPSVWKLDSRTGTLYYCQEYTKTTEVVGATRTETTLMEYGDKTEVMQEPNTTSKTFYGPYCLPETTIQEIVKKEKAA